MIAEPDQGVPSSKSCGVAARLALRCAKPSSLKLTRLEFRDRVCSYPELAVGVSIPESSRSPLASWNAERGGSFHPLGAFPSDTKSIGESALPEFCLGRGRPDPLSRGGDDDDEGPGDWDTPIEDKEALWRSGGDMAVNVEEGLLEGTDRPLLGEAKKNDEFCLGEGG